MKYWEIYRKENMLSLGEYVLTMTSPNSLFLQNKETIRINYIKKYNVYQCYVLCIVISYTNARF